MSAAFIVDGVTEKRIVQGLCPGSPVRMTNLNGKNVAPSAIAKAVHSLISLLKGRHYPIFVICDREGRTEASTHVERELATALHGFGVPMNDVVIACPDRMIENWMLADGAYLKSKFDVDVPFCEGENGKVRIRQLLQQKGISYHELTVGVDLFFRISPHRAASNSESFARFRDRAEPFCVWLRRPH